MISQVGALMGAGSQQGIDAMLAKLEQLKILIERVHNQVRPGLAS